MQSSAGLVASLILLIGVAVGVTTFFYYQKADAALAETGAESGTESGPSTEVLASRIDELEAKITGLQDELREKANAPQRQAIQPVTDAQIEAAVAKWMAANPEVAKAAAEEEPKKLNLDWLMAQFHADMSDADAQAIWDKLRKSGQVDEMIKKFEELAANNPNSADAQVAVGVAYCQKLQGMTPGIESGTLAIKADKTFDKALELNPQHWDARFVKAMALSFWPAMFGKQAEALKHLEILRGQQEARSSQPKKYAETYLMLGNLYSQQGKTDKAKEYWRKGADLFPDHAGLKAKVKE